MLIVFVGASDDDDAIALFLFFVFDFDNDDSRVLLLGFLIMFIFLTAVINVCARSLHDLFFSRSLWFVSAGVRMSDVKMQESF